ncbi:MAG: TlpA family protein disulfide reductase [Proteobacteria bacterium]|nr:TlpA family protein disulfide reductase [Pseudomonadota bacterium]
MKRISAPEFRGKICRYLVFPFLKTGAGILLLCLSVFVGRQSADHLLAAEVQHGFVHAPWGFCPKMFTLPALGGGERGLPLDEDRPVVIHFFATWCEPCKAEIGGLEKFYRAHKGKLEVLAVSVGEVRARVQDFFKQTPATFPVLLDADRAVTKAWSIETLPTSILLDTKLRPVLAATGELDWANADNAIDIDNALKADSISRSAECTKEHPQ